MTVPFKNEKPALILVRGIQGSGKSTVSKYFRDFRHIEADMYFGEHYKFDLSKVADAHEWCINETYESLNMGVDVVVSNTFSTLDELVPYFKMSVILGIVPTVILAQNSFKNVHGVPDEIVQRYRDRFECDVSPLFEEYFG